MNQGYLKENNIPRKEINIVNYPMQNINLNEIDYTIQLMNSKSTTFKINKTKPKQNLDENLETKIENNSIKNLQNNSLNLNPQITQIINYTTINLQQKQNNYSYSNNQFNNKPTYNQLKENYYYLRWKRI